MGRFGLRKLFQTLTGYRSLFREAKKTKPSLALVPVSQTTMGFVKDAFYILALRMAGVPVLIQLRGSNFKTWQQSANALTRFWVRFVLSRTEGVIVLGEKLRGLFEDFFSPERIHVAPNGADYPGLYKKISRPKERLRVLYLSNFLPGKAFDTVLMAFSELTEESLELIAHGSWDDEGFRQQCFSIASSANPAKIKIGEPVSGSEKWEVLNGADLFVFVPRHPEGHPWAIVEAMAAGLPVIATDRGAITESIKNGENGFIIPADDPSALAEKLRFFVSNPERLGQMGSASRKLYEHHFTADKMAGRYIDIFEKAIAKCAE
jgi:glycosyltransferase involved in cell wall biosynthesis